MSPSLEDGIWDIPVFVQSHHVLSKVLFLATQLTSNLLVHLPLCSWPLSVLSGDKAFTLSPEQACLVLCSSCCCYSGLCRAEIQWRCPRKALAIVQHQHSLGPQGLFSPVPTFVSAGAACSRFWTEAVSQRPAEGPCLCHLFSLKPQAFFSFAYFWGPVFEFQVLNYFLLPGLFL